ncbi:MAG: indolepyruvate ferredoxin oxidoreductase family protein [Pseudomonadota bacterium]
MKLDRDLRDDDFTFLSGINALVRLPIIQRQRDKRLGLNTAGLISGYRGSPLGAYDLQLWRAKEELQKNDVLFQPGLNEDLAATALWGAQIHSAYGETKVDGVFGIWYGKGPGVDRCGDVFRNANIMGTSALGGVLAIGGDDHAAQSSIFPHQTDGIFQSVFMPVLQPANVQDILDFGLAGIALSRYCGLWVAMKTIAEVVEASATIIEPGVEPIHQTPDVELPPHGLNWDPSLIWPAYRAEYERRLLEERLPAVRSWIAANEINKTIYKPKRTRLCIVTVGKAHQDVMQALQDLGINGAVREVLGVGVYKVGMSWPLETSGLMNAFPGAEEYLVVEEKLPIVEDQLKAALYSNGARARITGKTDQAGRPLLKAAFEFTPHGVARAIVARLQFFQDWNEETQSRIQRLKENTDNFDKNRGEVIAFPVRKPFFCSGCPHNRSTKTPEGSIAGGGIGCHALAISHPDRATEIFCQMGGEGMQWVGAEAFSKTEHVFQNLGDGTYQHSGILAIRAALAAGTNITFKILYNDAVAMTGGQTAEGELSPDGVIRQLSAEGVSSIALVSDDPEKWRSQSSKVQGAEILHRDDLEELQKDYRTRPGVTAIVYEQTCAAEKRRRRKRGQFPDPAKRILINPRVCEGCGDCSKASNCIAVEPIETVYGRKRRVNQSSCNKDFSCTNGFCPSFVEVENPVLQKPDEEQINLIEEKVFKELPEPERAELDDVCNIYVAGIGGLGVLTLGAIIGAAAYFDGKHSSVLDFTGLAQKNGGVVSHVRLAPRNDMLAAARVPDYGADLLIAADALVAASAGNISKLDPMRTASIVDTHDAPTSDNVTERDFKIPSSMLRKRLKQKSKDNAFFSVDASALASDIFGNAIAGNILLLGYAWQKGLVPLTRQAIVDAVTKNGAAVEMNLRAFEWGRVVAERGDDLDDLLPGRAKEPERQPAVPSSFFATELERYQDKAYSRKYTELIEETASISQNLPGGEEYLQAVTENAYKVMAYKDEYEVARHYSSAEFHDALKREFKSFDEVKVWLAPPALAFFSDGVPRKRRFGGWILHVFKLLQHGKALRGTWFDPFGHTQERRTERALIDKYFETIRNINRQLSDKTMVAACEVASFPQDIRGYGHVKEQAIEATLLKLEKDLASFEEQARSLKDAA